MPILLPNLDDRRWVDLVDEGRALIPFYAPEWTDQNAHDPGITLIELLAWFAEMDIFRLNRITDRAKLKFLSLVGIHPEPPRAATTVLSFSLVKGAPLTLPSSLEISGRDPFDETVTFQTVDPITVQSAALTAVQVKTADGFHDFTDRWKRGLPFGAFGDVPKTGAELYLGFDAGLAAGQPFSMCFTFSSPRAKWDERERIRSEAAARRQDCTPPRPQCRGSAASAHPEDKPSLPFDPGARLVWELLVAAGPKTVWAPLPVGAVKDDTRALTLDGAIVVTAPLAGVKKKIGQVDTPLWYVRVRLVAGAYDAPPTVLNLAVNAVWARQYATPPQPAGTSRTGAGSLGLEAVLLATGDGTPFQQVSLPGSPIGETSLKVATLEGGDWRTWRLRPDFDASDRSDSDFLLDATAGIVTFGDGDRGRTVPVGARIVATYLTTRGERGNVRARAVNTLSDSPHNHALLPNFQDVSDKLMTANPLPAARGAAAETLDLAIARAIRMLAQPQRAVTLSDYERLALETPGTDVARAKAWADHHPDFPCFNAQGVVSVVVLPNLPTPTPTPSSTLLRRVASYLNRRRIIGSRIEVTGPVYRTVAVQAQVRLAGGASKTALQQRVVAALNAFLHPLTGGPAGTGWPFGRDVYRAEMLQVIDQVPGVDYVATFSLFVDGCVCDPQCGNVCLAPTELVAAGSHEIEVLTR
jgi:predicted phage baseplate assembly protein